MQTNSADRVCCRRGQPHLNYPIVLTSKLPLPDSGQVIVHAGPRRRRRAGRRNRRMLFQRVKSHNVLCDERLAHLGFSTTEETAYSGIFQGFDNAGIMWSYMKSYQAAQRVIECLPLEKSICVSIPLQGNSDTFVYKVIPVQRRQIRVLSLFDGIGSAFHILSIHLGLKVDKYFSCEVDSDAISVLKHRYHGEIVMLGCVKGVNVEMLHSLGRIDYLCGGSPCNDLSRVNPRRQGFAPHSTGRLFFEFVRIRNYLSAQASRRGDTFFWLFENTCNVDCHVRETMDRCLGCEPVKCCASSYVGMKRNRYFWGNIPYMAEAAGEMAALRGQPLQKLLRPFRIAKVGCLPTLTTNSSSQKGHQGKLPIIEDGIDCSLTIDEREVLFGYPQHYTDVANLSNSRRMKLIGRSWCVPVVARLMRPLAEMFEKNEACPSH